MHKNERINDFDKAVKLFKQGKYFEAEQILNEILKRNRKDKYALFQMGKLKLKLHKPKEAEGYFKECIQYFPYNKYPRLELGKLYAKQGKEKEAEAELKRCIEIDQDRSPHARLELGKLYAKQGKEKEAEAELKRYIEIDQDRSPHARLELGRLYAIQGKNEDATRMYSYILNNIDDEVYSEENRIKHIQRHMRNDLNKSVHGVFTVDIKEVLDRAIQNKGEKQVGYMCDIYCIEVPNCGYQGGKDGDGHILNYVTLVTLPNSHDIITFFPSDKIVMSKDKKVKEAKDTQIHEIDEKE